MRNKPKFKNNINLEIKKKNKMHTWIFTISRDNKKMIRIRICIIMKEILWMDTKYFIIILYLAWNRKIIRT